MFDTKTLADYAKRFALPISEVVSMADEILERSDVSSPIAMLAARCRARSLQRQHEPQPARTAGIASHSRPTATAEPEGGYASREVVEREMAKIRELVRLNVRPGGVDAC